MLPLRLELDTEAAGTPHHLSEVQVALLEQGARTAERHRERHEGRILIPLTRH